MAFPISYGHFDVPAFSDHSPSCLVFSNPEASKKPFMFSHFLIKHKDFLPRVAQHWNTTNFDGTSMFVLSKKLKSLKLVLKELSRDNFSDLENRVKEAHLSLVECQENLLRDPSPQLARSEKEAHRKWSTLAEAENTFFKQRSRVRWVEEGDSNTAFFHRMVAERKGMNHIHYLLDSDGSRIDSQQDIQEHGVNYFQDLLGSDSPPLSQADSEFISRFTTFSCPGSVKEALVSEVTAEDIKREIFALPSNKSPGPDGFTGEFFRSTWDIVGKDVIAAVKEFFSSGQILRQWNATAITLIPKKTSSERIGDFRPISLCNAVYKVISKIISRRLQLALPVIISNTQSAFIKGRLLVENVLLATELVQGFNRKTTTPRGMLKVDLRKAFDSLRWDFILHVLQAAGFPPTFINWISQCLTTTSFSININGNLCGYFAGKKGLRQGDPISPYLFVIAMEVFSRIIESHFDSQEIGCHPLAKNPRISHLCFADDVMIFFDGSTSSLQGITTALTSFQSISGLTVNKEKSELFVAGVNPEDSNAIYSLGFKPGSLPIRYLGLPLLHRKLRKSDYSPLLDRIESKCTHWATKTLSFAGRLQLISSTIYSLVNFWMTAFSLPKGCLKRIEQLCGRFIWNSDISKLYGTKVSWSQVCLPKDEGGLGLRNFTLWNKVLNMRLIWLLFTSRDSLWVAWNKEHRLKHSNFWNAKPSFSASWVWRHLLSLRLMVKPFLKCSLGNGNLASFWFDSWAPCGPLIDLVGDSGPSSMGIPLSATASQAASPNGWKLPSVRSRNRLLLLLRDTLLAEQPPNDQRGPDEYFWEMGDGALRPFSTSRTWNAIRPYDSKQPWSKVVWFKGAVPKLAFHFWTAHLDRLPVRARLSSWGMNVPTCCCLCALHLETRDHIFLHCDYSAEVWSLTLRKLGLRPFLFQNWTIFINWLSSKPFGTSRMLNLLACHSTIYYIWRERNNRLHNAISSPPTALFRQIDRNIRDTLLARRKKKACKDLLSIWFTHM